MNIFVQSLKGIELKVLALDPGETTGMCLFKGSELLVCGQIKGPTLYECFRTIRYNIEQNEPDVVVMEDYKVYDWKAKDHSWSSLFTPRLIGALECYTQDCELKTVKQMAQQAKGFCTDDKLQAWGFWQKGERHARDAIRHACYYLLFEVAQVHKRNKKD